MFFGNINNIDFEGMGSMSGDMSPSDLYALFRNAIPQYESGVFDTGATDAELHTVINAFFSHYEIQKLPSDPGTGDSVTATIKPVVIGTVGAQRALRYQDTIGGILNGLGARGLYAVPIGYRAQAQPSQSVAPSAVAASVAYQGAVAAQQAGSPSIQQSFQQNITQPITAGIQSAVSAFTGRAPLPTIYRRQAYKQTPAERQRLVWIVGGFAVLFAVAMGVIAARSGD